MEQDKQLELSHLAISRQTWGADKGKLTGSIIFVNSEAQHTIKLSDAKAQAMLRIIADQLVENAHEFSKVLTTQVLPLQIEGEK